MKKPFLETGGVIRIPKINNCTKTKNYNQHHDGDVNNVNAFRHLLSDKWKLKTVQGKELFQNTSP